MFGGEYLTVMEWEYSGFRTTGFSVAWLIHDVSVLRFPSDKHAEPCRSALRWFATPWLQQQQILCQTTTCNWSARTCNEHINSMIYCPLIALKNCGFVFFKAKDIWMQSISHWQKYLPGVICFEIRLGTASSLI